MGIAVISWLGRFELFHRQDNGHLKQMNFAGILIPFLIGLFDSNDESIQSNSEIETQPELRDPFLPSDINSGSDKRKTVTLGDWVNGMRVIIIRNDTAVLANNKNMHVLYLF